MHKLSALAVLLASICAAEAAAQDAALAPGTRVRVIQATDQFASPREQREATLIGTVQAADSVSLTVQANGRSVVVPRNIIARVDVSQGKMSPQEGSLRGARTGAALGGSAMGMVYAIMLAFDGVSSDPRAQCRDCAEPERSRGIIDWLFTADSPEEIPVDVLRAAAVGAGVGAAVGAFTREIWVPLGADSRPLSVSVEPDVSGGARVGFSLRF